MPSATNIIWSTLLQTKQPSLGISLERDKTAQDSREIAEKTSQHLFIKMSEPEKKIVSFPSEMRLSRAWDDALERFLWSSAIGTGDASIWPPSIAY